MSMGLAMAGLENPVYDLALEVRSQFQPCTYLEIGVANGGTLCQIARIISGRGHGWRAIGVDLPQGYSLDRQQVEQNCGGHHFTVSWIHPEGFKPINPFWNRVSVALCDSRDFFEGIWIDPIHLALIDGCHCHECVMRDFQNIEKYMPQHGVVMFHDFDKAINDPQPHGDHCDVVGACEELGLLDNTRKGWSTPTVMVADKNHGGANMMAVR